MSINNLLFIQLVSVAVYLAIHYFLFDLSENITRSNLSNSHRRLYIGLNVFTYILLSIVFFSLFIGIIISILNRLI